MLGTNIAGSTYMVGEATGPSNGPAGASGRTVAVGSTTWCSLPQIGDSRAAPMWRPRDSV